MSSNQSDEQMGSESRQSLQVRGRNTREECERGLGTGTAAPRVIVLEARFAVEELEEISFGGGLLSVVLLLLFVICGAADCAYLAPAGLASLQREHTSSSKQVRKEQQGHLHFVLGGGPSL